MNITLRSKIFFSYIVMIVFTIVVGGYAIWNLVELNYLTTDLIYDEMLTGEKLAKLADSLLGQDLYEKRFLALGQAEAESMFWSRDREFRFLLSDLRKGALAPAIEQLSSVHDSYNSLFAKEAALIKAGSVREAEVLSSTSLKDSFGKMLLSLKEMDLKIKGRQNRHITKSNALSERALLITTVLSVVSLLFGLLFASLITNHLTTTVEKLKAAAHSIQSGDFDSVPEIKGEDELSDLAVSLKEMSARLKELGEMNLDANPLTKLPGNLAIEKELLTRLNDSQRFSFCLADLDNFKAFNDRYGYARGSEVIKWMGDLLSRILQDLGAAEDFLGHIGGDDFVLICGPERVQPICSRIIEEFDRGIVNFYDPDDLKKGFIVSIDRNDKPATFGIMTLSIAVVNADPALIREPKELGLKVTEIKQYAKTFAKSLYIMDRRRAR